jgi:hypothetical protein
MASHQINPPPSAGSVASFISAQEDAESATVPSPNHPRNLFGSNILPILPSYLSHYIDASSVALNMEDVLEEEEDCGRKDDNSVESADEAQVLTDSLVQNMREREEGMRQRIMPWH